MQVKRLGKAVYRMPDEGWFVEGIQEIFFTNDRLVDHSDEMKEYRKISRQGPSRTPRYRDREKREAFFAARDELKQKKIECLEAVYHRLAEESNEFPILLRRNKKSGRRHEWNYCLYRKQIYKFPRNGIAEDIMKEEIDQKESARQAAAEQE